MKSIKKAGFSSQYFLTEQGQIFNAKTNRFLKPFEDHTFKLKDLCEMQKTISLKSLYLKIYNKTFCIDNIQNEQNEVWKQIKGTNEYFISNHGRIKSYKRYESIILKPWKNRKNNSYFMVKLTINGITKNYLLHRLVAITFDPRQDTENYQVHHKDFNPWNNHADNLKWVTKEEHKRIHDQHNKQIVQKKVIQ